MEASRFSRWGGRVGHAWAAALFDGEGSLSIYRPRKDHPHICLEMGITMQDLLPIEMMVYILGGKVEVFEGEKRQYRWRFTSQKAVGPLLMIYPFLTCKRDQATVALEFLEWQSDTNTKTGYTASQEAEAERYRFLIKRLKEPGVDL